MFTSNMLVFVDAPKLPIPYTNRKYSSSSPGSRSPSSRSPLPLSSPLLSSSSAKRYDAEYRLAGILYAPYLKPIPLPPLSDADIMPALFTPTPGYPNQYKRQAYLNSTPPNSPDSRDYGSIRYRSPEMDGVSSPPSPSYPYHYDLPLSYTPPTPPMPTAHLVCAPITRYRPLPSIIDPTQ